MNADIAAVLARQPVLDGHNDLLWTMRNLAGYDFDQVDIAEDQSVVSPGRTHTDLPRLRAGGVGAQFWSVYVPQPQAQRLDVHPVTATLEQVDAAHAMIRRYADQLAFATTADDVESAWRDGRIACLLGAEGGHQIDGSLGVLRMLHRLGVRYLTLTHNENVPWADSATDSPAVGGLSDFGREVVAEMNRLGMAVDLSHTHAAVMRDALATTRAPVLFSHSSARAVCDHPRNVPDDVLAALPANGGVCMVTFVPRFVSQAVRDWDLRAREVAREQGVDPADAAAWTPWRDRYREEVPEPPSRLDDVVRHLEHVREIAGIEHIGLGGDYDGVEWLPEGLGDVTGYPRLLQALADRGWSGDDLAALTSGNVLRALRGIEAAAS